MPKRLVTTGAVLGLVAVAGAGAFAVGRSATNGDEPAAKSAPKTQVTLERVAPTETGQPVRLQGAITDAGLGKSTTVVLQRQAGGRWVRADSARLTHDASYGFVRLFDNPSQRVFRTVAVQKGKTVDVSPPQTVRVTAAKAPSGTELFPDLGAKKLTDCSRSEQPCFKIVNVGGERRLKFPAITVNIGNSPLEIHAYRATKDSPEWIGTRTTYYSSGDKGWQPFSNAAVFYWAGDGHLHWHIKDFDGYQILDDSGTRVAVGEKHGYCFEDNATYRDWSQKPAEHPGVPTRPVYKHSTSCGQGLPRATSIVHGLSIGWGDTYPTSLPDQDIDITGLPDGTYTVRVKVDEKNLIKESDETNNTATVKVTIRGKKVTVDTGSATGL